LTKAAFEPQTHANLTWFLASWFDLLPLHLRDFGFNDDGSMVNDPSCTLLSTTGSEFLGGKNPFDNSLKGVFTGYFREAFAVEFEKSLLASSKSLDPKSRLNFLVSEDFEDMDISMLKKSCQSIAESMTSSKGVMQHLENIGHSAAMPSINNTKKNLLPFQLETLKWAIERENMIGGVQSLLWTEISTADGQLFFNPALGCFSRDAPSLFWGGVFNENENLGVHNTALALTLENPAPLKPSSGSTLKTRRAASKVKKQSKWEAIGATTDPSSQWGKVISRGSLVIVSCIR
jgi:hypothetical protein